MTAAVSQLLPSRMIKLLTILSLWTIPTLLSQGLAHSQEAGMLWTCSSNSSGEWVCTGNDDAQPATPAVAATPNDEQTPEENRETTTNESPSTAVAASSTVNSEAAKNSSPPVDKPAAVTTTTSTAGTTQAPSTTTPSSSVASTRMPTSAPASFTPTAVSTSSQALALQEKTKANRCDARENPDCILEDRSLQAEKASLQEQQEYPRRYPKAYATPTAEQLAANQNAYGVTEQNFASSSSKAQNETNPGFEWRCKPSTGNGGWSCSQQQIQFTSQYQQTIPATAFPYAFLDWYSYSDGKAHPETHCSGTYIQPEVPAINQGDETSTYVNADQSQTTDNNYTTLTGNVHLQKGDKHLYASEAAIDHERELTTFQGQVMYREPNTLMLSQNAQLDQQQGTTEFNQVEYVFHQKHIRGDAERIVQLENKDVYITSGRYTRCEPGNEDWVLSGSEIILYQEEGYGVAKHATIRIGGVPVFYMPYFTFPIDDRRKSGWLFPTASYTKDNGFDIAAPYYFNIAPNMDDTLTPRYISQRGVMLENEFRYLNEYGSYELNLGLLPNDDGYDDKDRWLLGVNHSGRPFENTRTYIDYTAVSDNDYFDDLSTSLNISKETHLDKIVGMSYSGEGWNASAKFHGYQTITDASKPYQELPELTLRGNDRFYDDQLELSHYSEYSHFYRDNSEFTGIEATTGQRFYTQAAVSGDYLWPWAYIRPRATMTFTQYALTDQPNSTEQNPNRALPIFSVDSGLYFDRPMTFNDKAYTHTLEPRLFYLYVPYEDQSDLPYFDSSELSFTYSQLFRENRFSGRDRIGDANQVTLGVTTRLLEDSGAELGHISVGQIFYLEDRQVRLTQGDSTLEDDSSNFAAEGLWQVSKYMRFTADGEWRNNDFANIKRNFKLSYNSDKDHRFNIGYRFSEDDLEQAEASVIWPINSNWSVLARWLQDLDEKESLDQIAGLEYENCCWRVRTVFRSWIDDDEDDRKNNGIFLQFTLKGLGSVGTQATGDGGPSANDFLEDITGFRERELYDE